jgi:hypothetical protein
MNAYKAFFFLCLCGLLVQIDSYGQGGYSIISYNVSVPTAQTANFIDRVSWRGLGLEAGLFLNDQVTVGVAVNWSVFYANAGRQTVTEDNLTLTGNLFRYNNVVPVYAIGRYNFQRSNQQTLVPIVGLGVGGLYSRRETQMGLFAIDTRNWQFGLFPEVGFMYATEIGVGLFVSARYNYGFRSADLPTTSYLGLNVGTAFVF